MHPMLNTAVKAARAAGKVINYGSQNLDRLTIHSKRENDFVSEIDQKAEQAIIQILLEAYPDHAILAEESGVTGESEYQWVIDPLDGTTNFLHGFPQYAVSIALLHRGQLSQAVIYDPVRNDLYTASRGRGAFLNDRRIRVSGRKNLHESVLATGNPFRGHGHIERFQKQMDKAMRETAGIRRFGAAALDLAYVACGRYEGFWEEFLSPWDIAAGLLLVKEAGGYVSDFKGKPVVLAMGEILATNNTLHAPIQNLVGH